MYQQDNSGTELQQETSRFNEAGLQIMRLNDLWIRAEHYANGGRLVKWKFILHSIWRELFPDVKRMHDKKEMLKKNDFWILRIHESTNSSGLYFYLHKHHEFLKELQDKAGKGGSYESRTEADFD